MNGLGPSKQITFRVPREIGEEIDAAAKREGRKLAPFVENIVVWAFARYKEAASIIALYEGNATPKPTKKITQDELSRRRRPRSVRLLI